MGDGVAILNVGKNCVCSKYKFNAQSLEVTCINNIYDEKIYSRRITHNNVTLDA